MEKPVIAECVVFFINSTYKSNSNILTLLGSIYKKNDTFIVTGSLILILKYTDQFGYFNATCAHVSLQSQNCPQIARIICGTYFTFLPDSIVFPHHLFNF